MGITSVETFRQTRNGHVEWRAITVFLAGALLGLILWTPALRWALKSLGFNFIE
jgi:hypothetical protein